jgi:hypothetical protein
MIGFYQDANLTLAVTQLTPKRVLLPLSGGSRTSKLWLGDPYTATVTAQAAIGTRFLCFACPLQASGSAPVFRCRYRLKGAKNQRKAISCGWRWSGVRQVQGSSSLGMGGKGAT